MLVTVVFFILLLSLLVLAHEWGHFAVARRLRIRVEEFAFGFPPRLWSRVHRRTRFSWNLVPLGGYVRIFGEGGEAQHDPTSFSSRSFGERLAVVVAGVVMNVVLAWLLFSLGHGLGLPTVVGEGDKAAGSRVTIVAVGGGTPAEHAGLEFGDAITEFRIQNVGFKISGVDEVQQLVEAHRGEEITIVVERSGRTLAVQATPRVSPPAGEGALGIAMAQVALVRSPWWRAPWDGLKTTASAALAILQAFGGVLADLFSRGRVSADVAGPVGMFFFADQTRRLGLAYLLEFAGVVSVNLALINILPLPALDGGRVLFLFIEKLRGGVRVNERWEQAIHTIGLVLLLILMAAITYRDVVRIF